MPKSFEDIIREVLEGNPGVDSAVETLMQDPRMMKDTMGGGGDPGLDMRTNPQSYVTMDPPTRPAIRLDPVYRGERYDDSQTTPQSHRTNRGNVESQQFLPRTPTINPTQRPVDPDRDDLDMLFPGHSKTDPTVPGMQKLYRQMPMRPNPQPNSVPMTPQQYQQYNVPRQYEQPELDTMQQLMEFYQGGSEI